MKKMHTLAAAASLALAGLSASPALGAGVMVTPTIDATALANVLLGSGVAITNATLTGATNQQGTFTGGVSAGIGIESGVILTSGDARLAEGPNENDGATGDLSTPGDADLASLISPFSIFDANVLTITFTTTSGNLFFQYVFASEEYNEFVNTEYNDVFGFFINKQNIALIPGTNTPVAINNVNCGNPVGDPTESNCQYYNDNSAGAFHIEYDGFTDVFTASVTGLTPGIKYEIKLAIGDTSDTILDSAVFLKAGSFTDTDPGDNGVPEPGTLAMLGLGLAGLAAVRRRRLKGS